MNDRAPPFAHLSVHSCYSLRDGAIRPRELAAATAAAGMSHVALTDRDGLYGAVRFAKACAASGIIPVFGADLALAPHPDRPGWEITRAGRHRLPVPGGDSGRRAQDPRRQRPGAGPGWLEDDAARIVLLARDRAGYGNLCRAITAAHHRRDKVDDGFIRSAPHLTWEATTARSAGLYVLLGPDSPAGRLIAAGRTGAATEEVRRWMEAFGSDAVLVGVRHHLAGPGRHPGDSARPGWYPGDDPVAARTVGLADRLGLTAVAVNDVRYLRRDDAYLADVLTCIRGQVPVTDRHAARSTAEGWFKTAADLLDVPLFRERPDLLVNAQRVAESCNVDLGLHETFVPRLTGLDEVTAGRELRGRCEAGMTTRYGAPVPSDIGERLDGELAMIDRLGLHDYFLSVAQIVDGIREMGVLSACRGSAAGSLVCYLLRISDVDPVANGLVFERFMNPHRDEPPDIDIDVESARREDVYRMVIEKFGGGSEAGDGPGELRTACVAMVETFQARMAIREVGKALGLPGAEIDLVAKAFRRIRARDVRRAMNQLPELSNSRLDAGQLEQLFQVVERIDGFPRHLALHPCGIVLGNTALADRTPVERSANGFAMTQFDKDDVAALGLLKLDVLAVRLLSAMRHSLDLLPVTRGETLEMADVPPEDPEVYDLLATTRSVGVFQIESPGQRELLGRLQPDRFGDLVTEISLFRPGPVKADMVGPYVARRRGEETARYVHPLLEPALGETFGVVIYHEQVMQVIAALTGCDLSHADLIRRELADDRRLPACRAWALSRAHARGFDRATAETIWQQVESFASFGFCKAHAAAFAVPTYRSAWLKRHLLPEFVAGLLTHDPGMYPRRLLLDEARNFGVAVLEPDVNRSEAAYTVEAIDTAVADRRLELRTAGEDWRDPLPAGWTWPDSPASGRPVPPAGLDAGGAGQDRRWAIRVGLQDVKGMSETERESLLARRPYTSLTDLRRRGGISRPTAEHLCKAGAFDTLCGLNQPVKRRELLLEVEETWRGRGRRHVRGHDDDVEQERLALYADHRPRLPSASLADVVRDELEVLGLDVTRHVVAFYEPIFEVLGVVRAADLLDHRDGEIVRVAGVRVALQSPPVRSGQDVLFCSLDDRTGTVQTNFFESVLRGEGPRPGAAWTVLHSWLLVVEGRLRRNGTRGATVLAHRAWDLTRLWRGWRSGHLDRELSTTRPPPRRERRPQRSSSPEGGSAPGQRSSSPEGGSAPGQRSSSPEGGSAPGHRPAGLSAAMFGSGSR